MDQECQKQARMKCGCKAEITFRTDGRIGHASFVRDKNIEKDLKGIQHRAASFQEPDYPRII